MSIKDIYIPMFQPNILISSSISKDDCEKIKRTIVYHDYVRQCWINYKKSSLSEEHRAIDIQYDAASSYLKSICQRFKSEIRILSFQLLTDVVNWFHSNKILFTVHDCHEYEVSSITQEQLDSLNDVITPKYGENIKFIELQ